MIMPTRIKVDRPNPAPDSADASFTAFWSEEPVELDVAGVLGTWRNQKVPR